MSSLKRLERKFLKSLNEQCVLHFSTAHPHADHYDGVVMAIKPDFIVIREERDWEFDGIQIFPKRSICDIRDGKFEACANRIVRGNNVLSQVVIPEWLTECQCLADVLQAMQQQEFWPAVETLADNDRDYFFYLGPITKLGKKSFAIHAYDADGQWEQEYEIEHSEVFRIELESRYCDHFNNYMKSQPVTNSRKTKTKSHDKKKRTGK